MGIMQCVVTSRSAIPSSDVYFLYLLLWRAEIRPMFSACPFASVILCWRNMLTKNLHFFFSISLGTRDTLIVCVKDIFNWSWHLEAWRNILCDEGTFSSHFIFSCPVHVARKLLKSHPFDTTRDLKLLSWRR